MSHIRLIISDIDGTILNDHHQIDPQLAALIPDLKREEIPFVLASARSPKGMAPIAKELGIEDCPMACYNGALIQKGEQVLFEHPLDKNEARQFIDWANQHFPQVSINLYSGKDWMTDHLDQWSQEEARITGEKPHHSSPIGSFAGCDKAPPQIALNWGSRRDPSPLSCYFYRRLPFYRLLSLQSQLPRSHC